MRLFSAAMLAERLALAAVVMRKWQGSAWRAREAARPHTSLHTEGESRQSWWVSKGPQEGEVGIT